MTPNDPKSDPPGADETPGTPNTPPAPEEAAETPAGPHDTAAPPYSSAHDLDRSRLMGGVVLVSLIAAALPLSACFLY
jgi:hypothetical protein